jgi:hypothetical protein
MRMCFACMWNQSRQDVDTWDAALGSHAHFAHAWCDSLQHIYAYAYSLHARLWRPYTHAYEGHTRTLMKAIHACLWRPYTHADRRRVHEGHSEVNAYVCHARYNIMSMHVHVRLACALIQDMELCNSNTNMRKRIIALVDIVPVFLFLFKRVCTHRGGEYADSTCLRVCVCVCVYIHEYINIYVYIYIYIYI